MTVCPDCGHHVETTSLFCEECGCILTEGTLQEAMELTDPLYIIPFEESSKKKEMVNSQLEPVITPTLPPNTETVTSSPLVQVKNASRFARLSDWEGEHRVAFFGILLLGILMIAILLVPFLIMKLFEVSLYSKTDYLSITDGSAGFFLNLTLNKGFLQVDSSLSPSESQMRVIIDVKGRPFQSFDERDLKMQFHQSTLQDEQWNELTIQPLQEDLEQDVYISIPRKIPVALNIKSNDGYVLVRLTSHEIKNFFHVDSTSGGVDISLRRVLINTQNVDVSTVDGYVNWDTELLDCRSNTTLNITSRAGSISITQTDFTCAHGTTWMVDGGVGPIYYYLTQASLPNGTGTGVSVRHSLNLESDQGFIHFESTVAAGVGLNVTITSGHGYVETSDSSFLREFTSDNYYNCSIAFDVTLGTIGGSIEAIVS